MRQRGFGSNIPGGCMKRFLFAFAVLALAVASAKTYAVTLYQPSVLSGTELKPGDYKLELDGNKAVLTDGKQSVESPVRVETAETKFASTTVRYSNDDGKSRIQQIRLGGTKLRLVFD
jgi:hypothetical protein